MADVTQTIDAIRDAANEVGLPAFSRLAGVPYTTLVHWEKNGFRPKVLATFEKLDIASQRLTAAKLTAHALESKRDAA